MPAFTETVAHHLVLDDSRYGGSEPERFVCCPPLLPAAAVAGLGGQLFTGAVTAIGSDHCCYDLDQKRSRRHDVRQMPNGLPGVETRLPIIFSEYVVRRGLPVTRFSSSPPPIRRGRTESTRGRARCSPVRTRTW